MPRALRLRRELQALRLSIEVVLRCGLQALRLGITLVALINVASLINLASEAWTLLSNDLSSVIFRQSTEPRPVFETPWLTGTGFETLWTFLLAASSQNWTSNLLRYLKLDLVWILIFVSVLLNSLKPPEMLVVSIYIRSPDLIGALN